MERSVEIPSLIEKWSHRLKVGNWHVRFLDEDPPPDNRAIADSWHPKRVAVIRIRKDAPEQVWEECVVHEMLHVALSDWVADVKDLLERSLSPSLTPGTFARLEEKEEVIIDKITYALLERDVQCWDIGERDDIFLRAFPVET